MSLPLVIPYHDIDPTLIQFGPFAIRWYALSYIAGLALGWLYVRRLIAHPDLWWTDPGGPKVATKEQIDDLLFWATIGVLVGGRLGHVFFYGLYQDGSHYLENPLRIFAVWEGGMSYHGGALGVIFGVIWFCRRQKLSLLRIGDAVALVAPIGGCFGRIANFINGEIWGKPSNVPWAMVFPNDKLQVPRHPSQLYEAFLEGALVFAILAYLVQRRGILKRPGLTTGLFLMMYAVARLFVEIFYRDSNNKIEGTPLTIGEVLTAPMLVIGAVFIWHAYRDRFGAVPFADRLAPLSTYKTVTLKAGTKTAKARNKSKASSNASSKK